MGRCIVSFESYQAHTDLNTRIRRPYKELIQRVCILFDTSIFLFLKNRIYSRNITNARRIVGYILTEKLGLTVREAGAIISCSHTSIIRGQLNMAANPHHKKVGDLIYEHVYKFPFNSVIL